ncbi:hypothetical protein CDIK_1188 [Cucumispora dikerogammari]|nr:hypothetical protein CDIK_1188 [Cucumispora dikerogammari]
MSTVKKTNQNARKYVSKYLREFTLAADGSFFCILCRKSVSCKRKCSVDKHRSSENYQKAKERYNFEKKSFDRLFLIKKQIFRNFINAIDSAEISLYKMGNN